MSADEMPCGCLGHYDNLDLCEFPKLEAERDDLRAALTAEKAAREKAEAWKTHAFEAAQVLTAERDAAIERAERAEREIEEARKAVEPFREESGTWIENIGMCVTAWQDCRCAEWVRQRDEWKARALSARSEALERAAWFFERHLNESFTPKQVAESLRALATRPQGATPTNERGEE